MALIKSRYLLWFLLALPAWQYVFELFWPDRYYPEMMKNSGVLSMQLLIFTLCIMPVSLLLRKIPSGSAAALWLVRNRRYFGLAGFGCAVIHTVLYVRQTFEIGLIWLEAFDLPFGSGWIALLVLVPVAITSNNLSVRLMRDWWKPVQRLSYFAIAAGFLHWLLLDFFVGDVLVWIIVLVLAKTAHVALRLYGNSKNQPGKAALS